MDPLHPAPAGRRPPPPPPGRAAWIPRHHRELAPPGWSRGRPRPALTDPITPRIRRGWARCPCYRGPLVTAWLEGLGSVLKQAIRNPSFDPRSQPDFGPEHHALWSRIGRQTSVLE